MDGERVYGIDLGTTYSCIAYVDEASGRPIVVDNEEGELTTPSVVLFEEDGTCVVGREAKNEAVQKADFVVEMIKRNMGVPDSSVPIGGHDYSPEEISSFILRKVAGDAGTRLDTTVRDVVVTCPAYFGISEREATAKAGEIAGLNVLEIINEPTAAAIAYGLHDNRDQVVLVFDLGGGTFDVTMIEIKDGSVTVIATGGDHRLGGRDWDEDLVEHVARAWMREAGADDDPRDSAETGQDLWQRAESAKRALTTKTKTSVAVNHDGRRVTVPLTREQFDDLARPRLELTIQYTKELLAVAKELGYPRFDQLLLVGGSSKMPQVAERLQAEFGITPKVHEPDHAVAKGAAVYGQKLAIGDRIRLEIAKRLGRDPEQVELDKVEPSLKANAEAAVAGSLGMRQEVVHKIGSMRVVNVASHSFGIVATDKSGGRRVDYISNLVLAQDRLPASKREIFGTLEDNLPNVELRIMENMHRSNRLDLTEGELIGNALLALTPDLPEGSPIEVTFELGQDGRLKVTGKDLSHGGQTIEAEISTDRTLSDDEVAAAKSHATGVTVTG